MNCSELIASRRSVRKYLDKEVPNGLVERLLQAAHWAPSGGICSPGIFTSSEEKQNKKSATA